MLGNLICRVFVCMVTEKVASCPQHDLLVDLWIYLRGIINPQAPKRTWNSHMQAGFSENSAIFRHTL